MSVHKKRHIIALITAALSGQVLAVDSQAVLVLTDQARYWQSKGRGDLAAEAWQKLLRADANNADALYGLAMVEMESGRPDGARGYLSRLKQTNPSHPRTRALEQALQYNNTDKTQLSRARELASPTQRKYDESAGIYRNLFQGKPPAGDLAREYYWTLGGTDKGWEESRRALAEMHRDNPQDAQTVLAYGQVLTYREATRREGIALLNSLSARTDLGEQARHATGEALLWMDGRQNDGGLYRQYLTAPSADEGLNQKVRERMANLGKPGADRGSQAAAPVRRDLASEQAYALLDKGQTEAAGARFQAMLSANPRSASALGGLGVVRLRQQRYREAHALLSQAVNSGGSAQLRPALNVATYWTHLEDSWAANRADDLPSQRRYLERAVALPTRETEANLELGDSLARYGDLAGAERVYRQGLQRNPKQADLSRALYVALLAQDRAGEARPLLSALSASQLQKAGGEPGLQAASLRLKAYQAEEAGSLADARRHIDASLLAAPGDPWSRFELSRLELLDGHQGVARETARTLAGGKSVDALHAAAVTYQELGEWTAALAVLERIPQAERSRDVRELMHKLAVLAQVDQAGALARQGRQAEANRLALTTENGASSDATLLATAANAWAEVGDAPRAVGVSRSVVGRLPASAFGPRIQYATVLLKTGQDAEFGEAMRQISSQPLLTRQRREADKLRLGFGLRQVELQRNAGQLDEARNTLAEISRDRPNDPRIRIALARIHQSAGEKDQALGIFRDLLRHDAANLDAQLGAIQAATALKDFSFGQSVADAALKQNPNNPRLLAAAGRLARAQGKNGQAAAYYKAALDAEAGQAKRAAVAPTTQLAMDGGSGADESGEDGSGADPVPAGAGGVAQMPVPPAPPAVGGAAPALPPGYAVQSATGYMAGQTPVYIYIVVPNGAPGQAVPIQPMLVPQPGAAPVAAPAYAAPRRSVKRSAAPSPTRPVAPALPPAYGQQAAPAQPPQQAIPYTPVRPAAPSTLPAPAPLVVQKPAAVESETAAIRRELDELESRLASSLSVGLNVRGRNGDAGRSELLELEAPIEGRISLGYEGQLVLKAAAVGLDAGRVNNGVRGESVRFGSNALGTAAGFSNTEQRDSGVAFSIGYSSERLKADIGSTPQGFRLRNTVGGIRVQTPSASTVGFYGEISRRAVTDSLLSYAGTRDNRTGRDWGGVVSTGGELGTVFDDGTAGGYASLQYHRITGTNVADNTRVGANGGFYVYLANQPEHRVTLGADVTYARYKKNLRYFTLGHGGYFSPQQYAALALPMDYTGRSGRMAYQMRGAVGVQHFRESEAPWFPNEAGLQTTLAGLATTDPVLSTGYAGQSKTGGTFRLQGALEYQIGGQLFLGGALGFESAKDYRQGLGGVYLRYSFDPVRGPILFPPRGPGLRGY